MAETAVIQHHVADYQVWRKAERVIELGCQAGAESNIAAAPVVSGACDPTSGGTK
jgi:hypothetical protein